MGGGVVASSLSASSAADQSASVVAPAVGSASTEAAPLGQGRSDHAQLDRDWSQRAGRDTRSAERGVLTTKAKEAAAKRAKALARQRSDIKERGKAIEKERAAERKRKAVERRRKAAAQGYALGTTDPREIARQIMRNKFSWGAGEFSCYDSLIKSESNWNIHATNSSSGAYGIPQALPGNKMASVASDWQTNPATQIRWGLQYVRSVYGTPCSAWSFKQGHHWY
nr:hypothetical protein [Microlunatus panaciterrae]